MASQPSSHLGELVQILGTYNLTNTSTNRPVIYILNSIAMALITLVVVARIYVRSVMVKSFGWDDALMCLALLSSMTLSILCVVGAYHGLGTHIWFFLIGNGITLSSLQTPGGLSALNSADITSFLTKEKFVTQILYACYIAYATAATFTKFSIIASYRRIFPNPAIKWFIVIVGILNACTWVMSVCAIVFECIPVQAAWDWTIDGSRCINLVEFFYISSAINVLADVLICLAPIPILAHTQMPINRRVILCVLFGFGLFACLAGVLRLTYLHEIASIDVTYSVAPSLIWSVTEVDLAIICGSVPSLRPIFTRLTRFPNTSVSLPKYDNPTVSPSENNIRGSQNNGCQTDLEMLSMQESLNSSRHMNASSRPTTASSQPSMVSSGVIGIQPDEFKAQYAAWGW